MKKTPLRQTDNSTFVHPLGSHHFADMMVLRDTTSARCSSWDRTGANMDFQSLEPGGTLEIAEIKGAGCIRHIYFTLSTPQHYMNDLVLRMYWDGSQVPCVETPFGDFFGMRYDRVRFFQSLMVAVNPGAGRHFGTVGFNSYFPMPFAAGARITLTQEGREPIRRCWSHVDFERFSHLPDDVGRFHAQWRRANPTTPVGPEPNKTLHNAVNLDGKENYTILEAEGHGNVAGLFLHVDNISGKWYGEGDDMIFIDGDTWPPSIHGTGTEEIFGGGACPDTEYIGPYTGWLYCGNKNFDGKVSMYRFYVADPIRFRNSIRMTIEHGHANNYGNDYSSTVFWYQNEPHADFPQLPPPEGRYPRVGKDEHEQAYRLFVELNQRVQALRRASRESNTPLPDVVNQYQLAFPGIERAMDSRENRRVIEMCGEWLGKLNQAGG